jgi:hypothetical protein
MNAARLPCAHCEQAPCAEYPARPRQDEFTSDEAYVRAVHARNQVIANAANEAFDQQFRRAMRRGRVNR